MAYGLNKKGQIEDAEWFWQEVALRAKNNYGEWNNKTYLAKANILQAIEDIWIDTQANQNKLPHFISTRGYRINKIVCEMI